MLENQSPQIDRRRFGILAAWGLLAAGVTGGRALAATEEELLREAIVDDLVRLVLIQLSSIQ